MAASKVAILVGLAVLLSAVNGFSLLGDFEGGGGGAGGGSDSLPPMDDDPCFDAKLKKPRSCVPDFVNAAYGTPVAASSTCGSPSKQYCGSNGKCHMCDEKENAHPPHFLTDLHNPNNVTCWQSDFVNRDTKENVTLTVSLKKKYELTYISLHFCHAKPHSMAIMKSMDHGKTWQPFQYYSADCRAVFGREVKTPITRANEQVNCMRDQYIQLPSCRYVTSLLSFL